MWTGSAVWGFRDNIARLLEQAGRPAARGAKLYAILVSFRALGHLERLPDILSGFHGSGARLRASAGADPVPIAETDFVILTEQSEYAALGLVSDVKMLLLKLIARHAPDAFAGVDQARLVRVFEMPRHRAELVQTLQEAGSRSLDARPAGAMRMLTPADIAAITVVIDAMPRQEFVDRFVKSQPIAVVRRGAVPQVALSEYFVSIAQI